MDPTTTVTSFATIVSLIADFVSHRSQRSADDYAQFIEWLCENRHDELVKLLGENARTSTSIKALLSEDRAELTLRLDHLDSMLARLASGFDEFAALAREIRPEVTLSSQALRILREFSNARAAKALAVDLDNQRALIFFDGPGGAQKQLVLDEPQFADDDIRSLIEWRFLHVPSYNSSGKPIYGITRVAAEFISQLDAAGLHK